MNRVRQDDVPWVERRSPKGRYHRFRRDLSGALALAEAGPALPGRAPFAVEVYRIPAGTANFPFHAHAAEWECYVVVSGTGTVRSGDGRTPLAPGDCVLFPPGEPHQIINDGDSELVYYVIANNAAAEVWHYPDSDKWGFTLPTGGGAWFRRSDVPYYEDEE